MKLKSLVTFSFILHFYCGWSQMVVNDPQANGTLLKQIAHSMETVRQTKKTVEFLKQAKELYEDVNSAIQTLDYVKDLSLLSQKIVKSSGQSLKYIQNSNAFTTKEMAIISSEFGGFMERSNTILKISNDILNGGVFKMKDAERFQLLKDSRSELSEALMDVRLKRKKYLTIAEDRRARKFFNFSSKKSISNF